MPGLNIMQPCYLLRSGARAFLSAVQPALGPRTLTKTSCSLEICFCSRQLLQRTPSLLRPRSSSAAWAPGTVLVKGSAFPGSLVNHNLMLSRAVVVETGGDGRLFETGRERSRLVQCYRLRTTLDHCGSRPNGVRVLDQSRPLSTSVDKSRPFSSLDRSRPLSTRRLEEGRGVKENSTLWPALYWPLALPPCPAQPRGLGGNSKWQQCESIDKAMRDHAPTRATPRASS